MATQTLTLASDRPGSTKAVWTGRILSGLAIAFLALDVAMKIAKPIYVTQAMAHLGYPDNTLLGIATSLAVCTVLYTIPRTSVPGAIFLTGYLGGATASHVRAGDPFATHALFPSYVALLVWGGLYLREPRLRELVPLRR